MTAKCDGACWPNPGGKASYGFTLEDSNGVLIEEGHGVVGTGPGMSNNTAEFHALRQGLIAFQRHTAGLVSYLNTTCACGRRTSLTIIGDSDLVVKIMSGEWKPTPGKLYYEEWAAASVEWCRAALYASLQIQWVPRELNQRCDNLSYCR